MRKKRRKKKEKHGFPEHLYARAKENFEVTLFHYSQNPTTPDPGEPIVQAVYRLVEIQEVYSSVIVKKKVLHSR